MKILITGSKGQLGKEVFRQLSDQKEHTLFLCDFAELDITDMKAVQAYIDETQPEVIINCAAYTAVDQCEEETEYAYAVNAIGARNLAIVSEKIGAKLVHISTDYVFDGNGVNSNRTGKIRPYNEFDTPNPMTVYGASKLAGENFVKEFSSKYFIIRTAWLYGDGENFVKTVLELSEELSELKVVDDQYGSPTSTYELTKGILSLLCTENYGLYHGTCEGQCSWYEFAKEIFRLKGIKVTVKPCTSEEYPGLARRPHWSVIENMMMGLNGGHKFAHWKKAIEAFIINEKKGDC